MKNLILITAGLIAFIFSQSANAQSKYQELEKNNGVIFYYKWKHSKIFKKDSPVVLLLKIENTNEYTVKTDFVVDYFWETLRKVSSPKQSFCIKANKNMKGRLDKLGFDKSTFSNDDILSEKFILEISGVKVNKIKQCPKK